MNNKHERLFCCGRRGVNYLIINSSQFFYIITILYLAYKVVTLPAEIAYCNGDSTKLAIHLTILFVGVIVLLYIWFGIVPGILSSYTLTTSVEMMKDRESINKVIGLQRMERTKRSHRIYQVLKLIRREMIVEFRK